MSVRSLTIFQNEVGEDIGVIFKNSSCMDGIYYPILWFLNDYSCDNLPEANVKFAYDGMCEFLKEIDGEVNIEPLGTRENICDRYFVVTKNANEPIFIKEYSPPIPMFDKDSKDLGELIRNLNAFEFYVWFEKNKKI
jgi:hypothetical protein